MPGGEISRVGQGQRDSGSLYSPAVGLVYLFNLIVGTGALTMPKAFATAGWLVSLILVILLAGVSYMTATFVIESMASANGMKRWKKQQSENKRCPLNEADGEIVSREIDEVDEAGERRPLLEISSATDTYIEQGKNLTTSRLFDITETIEMTFLLYNVTLVMVYVAPSQEIGFEQIVGQMAEMFFSRVGRYLFYLCIVIYLYGDLAIYAAAVPKSLRDVSCTYYDQPLNGTACSNNLTEADLCWNTSYLTRGDAYRIFVAAFALLLGPFVYFNLQKTKYLQILTTLLRWISFLMMIVLAVIQLAKGKGQGHPKVANLSGIPNLFGVCVYAFMCHHSLPQMVTPIRNKSSIFRLVAADYSLILVFYCLLSFTGIFCFSQLDDLYTLDFQPNRCGHHDSDAITNIVFVQYFLALFPVFTLSASFPIIAITLRNNLKVLFQRDRPYPWAVDRLFFPTLTIAIPIAIALGTNNLQTLVGITGSYAGTGIQYVIPACFVLLSRQHVKATIGDVTLNEYRSPFQCLPWIILIFVWSVVCVAFVTANYIISGASGS